MANLTNKNPRLRRVQTRLLAEIDALSELMEAGEISPEEWAEDMNDIIGKGMNAAMMAGKGARTLTPIEQTAVARMIAVQLEFLNAFMDEIINDGWEPSYNSRAQMYGTSTTAAFAAGDVVRQAGQTLPLPSMPTEGTQCLTNCNCEWKIDNINPQNGDWDAYWRLGGDDNCQTCVVRARIWSPIQIRKWELMLS